MTSESIVKVSLQCLSGQHHSILTTALTNLLTTKIAEQTYAQIVDGLPLSDVWAEYSDERHDPIRNHRTLCPGSLETVESLRLAFNINILELDATIVQAFQTTSLTARNFPARLIEIVSTACHGIAVLLFQRSDNIGSHLNDLGWQPPPVLMSDGTWTTDLPSFQPSPTVFYHCCYMHADKYPSGVADIVGYWAEAQIFGGVVLFDRGWSEVECKGVYLNPSGGRRPVFELSDMQVQSIASFLSSSSSTRDLALPIPIRTFERTTRRVDRWNAWCTDNIFRSRYESDISPHLDTRNCTPRLEDYPFHQDVYRKVQELLKSKKI